MKILIDNIYYEVNAGKNLLEACIGLGLDLPYFCYHPAMGSVGACRQCAVKRYANTDDKKGRIIMACMEPVTEGMIISVEDPEARQFRAGVIESLMINHPHDCPICDEGGECHLQDMTVMTGHSYRRFAFKKRTFISQDLGPFIHHELNRCIQCYRCVRFYRDYAGGKDLNVFGSASTLYFGRKEDGVLESEFSGNLVEVCPTGVFTDKTLKQHYTRKWDLTNSPSVCIHCSVGCNTLVGERYGMLRRVMNRYHGDINGYFLCDRGRFGYEFAHQPSRLKNIVIRDQALSFTGSENFHNLFTGLDKALNNNKVIGIGSPRASLESNFALLNLVGKERFYNGISRKESRLTRRALELLNSEGINAVSLNEMEKCDAAFILNEDVTQTAPVMALSLRQMIRYKAIRLSEKAGIPAWNDAASRELSQHEKSPLYIAHPYQTKLDDCAKAVFYNAPTEIARLGYAVAAAIDASAPKVEGLTDETIKLAQQIADDLLAAERPLIVTGIIGSEDVIFDALTNILNSLSLKNKKPSLAVAFPESNSAGIATLNAGDLEDALEYVSKEPAEILIVLENDLFRRISAVNADKLLGNAGKVFVIDHLMHPTAKRANVVLPAAVWAESSGTIVNHEGRAQRYYSAIPVNDPVKESWQWIIELMKYAGITRNSWISFDDVVNTLAQSYPALSALKSIPGSGFRIHNEKVARQTMRFSGRTAITADIAVGEPKPPEDINTPLVFSMEGYKGRPPASLIPYYWTPGWNSPQAVNKYLDEPNSSVKGGDPGVKIFTGSHANRISYIDVIPPSFKPEPDSLYLVPVPRIFGSEELSSHGQAISLLITSPTLLINQKEADRQNIKTKDIVTLYAGGTNLKVTIQTDNMISDGIAALTILLPGMESIEFPLTGKIFIT